MAGKTKTEKTKKKRLPKVTRVAENTEATNEVPLVSDPRFAAQHWDPRFGRIPTKTTAGTGATDERFEAALKTDRFKTGSSRVDRFGRPKRATVDRDSSDSELEEEAVNVGLSSDSESESDIADEEVEAPVEKLGPSTKRMAVTKLDWTSTRAVDIYACFASVCQSEGSLKRVSVYPSKLGLRRLAAEARLGPAFVSKVDQGLLEQERARGTNNDNEKVSESEDSDSDSGSDAPVAGIRDKEREKWRTQKTLRKYEMEKLDYFFAVAEFENINDANAVYDQCDGVEYAQSRCVFNLSFVPDDMEMDRTPREVCECIPDGYAPPNVAPNTLSNSTVQMTWDADDPSRVVLKRRAIGRHELDEGNLKAYLASASEDEKEDETEIERKRKLLLGGIMEEEQEEEEEIVEDMVVKFEPGMLEKGQEIVRQHEENRRREGETPWQARMRRMEERKAEKKRKRMERLREDEEENVVDEGPATFDDPFFKNTEGASDFKRSQKAAKKQKRNMQNGNEVDEAEKQRQAAELELLLVDDRKQNGNEMKHVLAQMESDDDEDRTERRKKKRTRGRRRADMERKEKKLNARIATPSALDTKDERFQGLFDNHLFAIDPTHPKFKKDETTQRIVTEKQKRYREIDSIPDTHEEKSNKSTPPAPATKVNVMDLAVKIKAKAKRR